MSKQIRTAPDIVELVSPFSLDDCCRLLQAQLDGPLNFFGARPLIGRVNKMQLRARKRIDYGNSFQTTVIAKMTEEAGQTHIRCRFSIHPFAKMFLAIWFGFVVVVGGSILIASFVVLGSARFQGPPEVWAGLLIPATMFAAGFGMVRFGKYLARDERQFLLDLITKTLKASVSS